MAFQSKSGRGSISGLLAAVFLPLRFSSLTEADTFASLTVASEEGTRRRRANMVTRTTTVSTKASKKAIMTMQKQRLSEGEIAGLMKVEVPGMFT